MCKLQRYGHPGQGMDRVTVYCWFSEGKFFFVLQYWQQTVSNNLTNRVLRSLAVFFYICSALKAICIECQAIHAVGVANKARNQ